MQNRFQKYRTAPVDASGIVQLPPDPIELEREARAARSEARSADAANRAAEAAQRAAGADARTAENQNYDNVLKLRGAYENLPIVKEYRVGLQSLASAQSRAPDATGDTSLIYDYAKAMDPGSVVREAEMGMAQAGDSIIARTAARLGKELGLDGAGGLSPEVRERLKREIATKVTSMNKVYSEQRRRYIKDAQAFGIDPVNVVGNHDGDVFINDFRRYEQERGNLPPPAALGSQNEPKSLSSGWQRDKSLAGAEKAYRQMLAGGRDAPYILEQLGKRGVPIDAGLARSVREQVEFRRKNPGVPLNRYSTSQIEQRWNEGSSGVGTTLRSTLGLYANSATAGLPQMLAGDDGTDVVNAMRANAGNYGTAAEMTGAITGMVMGDKGLRAAAPAMGRVGQAMLNNPFARQVGVDLSFGAAYGANTNPDDPLMGALKGAGGAAAGSALGRYVVGPGLAAVGSTTPVRTVLERGAGMFSRRFDPPQRLSAGERILTNEFSGRNAIDSGNVLGWLDEAASLNVPAALVDADPALRQLGGSAARKSPDALRLATDTFGPRALGQGERAIGAIDQHLAPVGDVPGIMQAARTRAQDASEPFYRQAMSREAPQDAELSELLRYPALEGAARDAYTLALNKGENPAELSFIQTADGQTILDANPNWRTLQYMKMGLDSVVERHRDPLGRLNLEDPAIAALDGLRRRFVGRLGALNPDYAAGNATYARFAGQGDAAQQGAAATASRVTPEDTGRTLSRLSDEQRPFFQQGYASNLADTVERGRLSGNPFNAVYGSLGQRAKIGQVFPEGAPTFGRIAGMEDDMARTSNELLGGSQTQPRAVADEAFDNGGWSNNAFDLGVSAATGVPPLSLMGQGLRWANDTFRVGMSKRKADELAPILYNTNPGETAANLRQMIDLANRRRAYERRAGMFASGALAPVGLTLAQ